MGPQLNVRRRSLVLAVPLAGLTALALAAGAFLSGNVDRQGAAESPQPTMSDACRPFAARAVSATHTGPPPPQAEWDRLAAGASNGATSLHDAIATSDLVLVARWVGHERFGSLGDPGASLLGHYAVAVMHVDRLIHGTLPPGCVDFVRVPFLLEFGSAGSPFPEVAFAALQRTRLEDPAVLFLQSWGGMWERSGGELPDWVAPLDRTDIYKTIGIDGALPIEGDRVSDIVFENDMAPWRQAVAGARVEDVIGDIAEIADGLAASPDP